MLAIVDDLHLVSLLFIAVINSYCLFKINYSYNLVHAYKLSNEFLAEEIGSEINAPKYYHTVQRVLSTRPNFCEESISLPSINICDYYVSSNIYQIM